MAKTFLEQKFRADAKAQTAALAKRFSVGGIASKASKGGQGAGAWGTALMVGLAGIEYILSRGNVPTPRPAQNKIPYIGPVEPVLVYGLAAVEGQIVYAEEETSRYAVKGGHVEDNILHLAMVLGRGAMESIEGLLVDGQAVNIHRESRSTVGSDSGDFLSSKYNFLYSGYRPGNSSRVGHIQIREYFKADGTQGKALQDRDGPWDSTCRLKGWSWVYVRLDSALLTENGGNTSTRPFTDFPRFTFIVKGRKIYWPGMPKFGASSHQATWTENMAACLYDYRRMLFSELSVVPGETVANERDRKTNSDVLPRTMSVSQLTSQVASIDTTRFAASLAECGKEIRQTVLRTITSVDFRGTARTRSRDMETTTPDQVISQDTTFEKIEVLTGGTGPRVRLRANRLSGTDRADSRIPLGSWFRQHRITLRIDQVLTVPLGTTYRLELSWDGITEEDFGLDHGASGRTDEQLRETSWVQWDLDSATHIALTNLPTNQRMSVTFFSEGPTYPASIVAPFSVADKTMLDDINFAMQGYTTWHENKFLIDAGRDLTAAERLLVPTIERDDIIAVGDDTVSPELENRINEGSILVKRMMEVGWEENLLVLKNTGAVTEDKNIPLERRLPDIASISYQHAANRVGNIALRQLRLFRGLTITLAPKDDFSNLRYAPGDRVKFPDVGWTPYQGDPEPDPTLMRITKKRINADFSVDYFIREEPINLFAGVGTSEELEPEQPTLLVSGPGLESLAVTSSKADFVFFSGPPILFPFITLRVQKIGLNLAGNEIPDGDPDVFTVSVDDFPYSYSDVDPLTKFEVSASWQDVNRLDVPRSITTKFSFTTLAAQAPPAVAADTFTLTAEVEALLVNFAEPADSFVPDWKATRLIWGTPAQTGPPPVAFAELGRFDVPKGTTEYRIAPLAGGAEVEVQVQYVNRATPEVAGASTSKTETTLRSPVTVPPKPEALAMTFSNIMATSLTVNYLTGVPYGVIGKLEWYAVVDDTLTGDDLISPSNRGGKIGESTGLSSPGGAVDVSNIRGNTLYWFEYSNQYQGGTGFSPVLVKTQRTPLPAAPAAPTASSFPVPSDADITDNSIRVTINRPPISGMYANLRIGLANPQGTGFAGGYDSVDVTASEHTFVNRRPNLTYRIEMRFGLAGSALSAAFSRDVRTDAAVIPSAEPTRPSGASDISMITHNSAQITYSPDPTYRTRVQVGLAVSPFVALIEEILPSSSAATATVVVRPLDARTEYEVRVAKINAYGQAGPYAGQN